MELHNSKIANYSKAYDLFNRSAAEQNGDGFSGLGYMYLQGLGVE
jgi:TPR repeat protein